LFERLKVNGLAGRHVFNPARPLTAPHIGIFPKLHDKRSMRRQQRFVCRGILHVFSDAEATGCLSLCLQLLTDSSMKTLSRKKVPKFRQDFSKREA
jgi:hypothetical protein